MFVTRYQFTVFTVLLVLLDIFAFRICVGQVHKMLQRSALRENSVEVIGEITQLGRVGKGGDIVRYTFIANGGTASGMSVVPPQLMRGLGESSSLRIRYLPSNPAINHPAAWEWSLTEETGSIFVSVFIWAILLTVFLMFHVLFFAAVNTLYRQRQ